MIEYRNLTGKKANHDGFVFLLKSDEQELELSFENERKFHDWSDGFCFLLGKAIQSPSTLQAISDLVNLEQSVQSFLLNCFDEKVSERPAIPRPPSNLDFVHTINWI